MHELRDLKVAVIGLGYVGLPLALEFARHQPLIGFDIQTKRLMTFFREGSLMKRLGSTKRVYRIIFY